MMNKCRLYDLFVAFIVVSDRYNVYIYIFVNAVNYSKTHFGKQHDLHRYNIIL